MFLTNGTIVTIIWTSGTKGTGVMIIKTRVFELSNGKYHNLSGLAKAMGLSISQVYRVREGKRGINQKFIIGAKKAFPDYRLDELFYLDAGKPSSTMIKTAVTTRYHHIVQRFTVPDF
jgi:hypothetical protein